MMTIVPDQLSAPAAASVGHPAWCTQVECFIEPGTGYRIHGYAPPPVITPDGTTITLTVVRCDTADGPGVARAYVESTSEREGTILTVGRWPS